MRSGFKRYKTIFLPVILGLVILLGSFLLAPEGLIQRSLRFIFNLTLLGIGTALWLAFFSQFMLPVRGLQDRINAFLHLIYYVTGTHGPFAFIENGQNPRPISKTSDGPGLLVLDTASAALLRTNQRFTRAVGPGVVFTQPGEQIADVVDLRLCSQIIGPRPNEDPFAPRRPEESQAEYESRVRRSNETRAVTRDNFEIIPQIEVIFRLDTRPGLGNSEFGYDPSAVERAILGQVVNANLPLDTPNRLIRWDQLPAQLAAEVWRDLVARLTLDDLFPLTLKKQRVQGLANVVQIINERLTQPEVLDLDITGNQKNGKAPSREYQILISRGIKVLSVNLFNVKLRPETDRELVNRWNSGWLTYARQEREQIDILRRTLVEEARHQAWNIFIETATCDFGDEILPSLPDSLFASPPSSDYNATLTETMRSTLLRLLRGHLTLLRERPNLKTLTYDEEKQITELITLLEARYL